jgi:hypothetical protein
MKFLFYEIADRCRSEFIPLIINHKVGTKYVYMDKEENEGNRK